MRFQFTYAIGVVAIALSLSGCKREPSPTIFVDPALAILIPEDVIFVGGVRLGQIQSRITDLPLLAAFGKEVGVDLHRKLWELVVAHDGRDSYVLLRGKFSEMGLEPRLDREGGQRLRYKNYTMLGDPSLAILFLNPTTAIASSEAALRKVIDNRDKTNGMPEWVREKLRLIPSTNQIWFVRGPQSPFWGGADAKEHLVKGMIWGSSESQNALTSWVPNRQLTFENTDNHWKASFALTLEEAGQAAKSVFPD